MSRTWSSEHDHLAALALPLHPREVPSWSWDERGWVWVPAWGTEPELLGKNGGEAGRALLRLRQRITCVHGIGVARTCADCRDIVAAQHATLESAA